MEEGVPFPHPFIYFFFSVLLIVLLIGEVLKILDLSSPMPASYPDPKGPKLF